MRKHMDAAFLTCTFQRHIAKRFKADVDCARHRLFYDACGQGIFFCQSGPLGMSIFLQLRQFAAGIIGYKGLGAQSSRDCDAGRWMSLRSMTRAANRELSAKGIGF